MIARRFKGLGAFTLCLATLVGIATLAAPAEGPMPNMRVGDWTLQVSANGRISSLKVAPGIGFAASSAGPPFSIQIVTGSTLTEATPQADARVSTAESGTPVFEWDLSPKAPLHVRYTATLVPLTTATEPALYQTIVLVPQDGATATGAVLHWNADLFPPGKDLRVFIPRQDGVGGMRQLDRAYRATWLFTANPFLKEDAGERLAIPMLSLSSVDKDVRLTLVGDPLWSMGYQFETPIDVGGPQHAAVVVSTDQPFDTPLTYSFWTVIHSGGPEEAMKAWYATALKDVPPGPDWLHDIAWQDYDYLSHGGKGWFDDLDAVEKYVSRDDRSNVIFALHGWYDLLGRYTYDAKKNRLDDSWMAFPNAPAMKGKGFPTSEAVPMTKAEMHRRIKYAKDRGVRVALYFADGLTACEGAGRLKDDRVLYWGGWNGPDTMGRAYCQNPANPEVYKWYVDYLKALLAEYGNEIDAFVWDETFMVRAGMKAPKEAPEQGYVAPAMMRLVRELTQTTTAYRNDLAFLTSDCVGATSDEKSRWLDVPPYAIMSHGTYQDSHSRPSVWPYGIFANYRNMLWSCNWNAVTRFDYTKFGVEHFDTPVATSNGWLDDKGIARLSEKERAEVVQLFDQRKMKSQQLHWLTAPLAPFVAEPGK